MPTARCPGQSRPLLTDTHRVTECELANELGPDPDRVITPPPEPRKRPGLAKAIAATAVIGFIVMVVLAPKSTALLLATLLLAMKP